MKQVFLKPRGHHRVSRSFWDAFRGFFSILRLPESDLFAFGAGPAGLRAAAEQLQLANAGAGGGFWDLAPRWSSRSASSALLHRLQKKGTLILSFLLEDLVFLAYTQPSSLFVSLD